MLQVVFSAEAEAKLKQVLKDEDDEDAVYRIRETKVGQACKSHMELRLGVDEREDPDEEQEGEFGGMPFVVNNDVIDTYGESFEITLNAEGLPLIKALS